MEDTLQSVHFGEYTVEDMLWRMRCEDVMLMVRCRGCSVENILWRTCCRGCTVEDAV